MNKIKLALVFGGKSAEHEISLISAKCIFNALDRNKYDVKLIGINKSGKWFLSHENDWLSNENDPKLIHLQKSSEEILFAPEINHGTIINLKSKMVLGAVDVVFPVLHGTYGEDGTIQGLLKAMNIPFVGPDILGSAIGMDKDVSKRLLRDAGIDIADFVCITRTTKNLFPYETIVHKLGLPLFIKPANAGSSVGVHKVHNKAEFDIAIGDAFKYDNKLLVEEAIKGRELECAILGNEYPMASEVGEVIPKKDFYSYEAKYLDVQGAELIIPAQISNEERLNIQKFAVNIFTILCCEGMARVDFFLCNDGRLVLNEINTIPGFTNISMYPKLWEASGISYSVLIDHLIRLAMERHQRNQSLVSSL